jgi:hypothetical protein
MRWLLSDKDRGGEWKEVLARNNGAEGSVKGLPTRCLNVYIVRGI